jgi:hypothetical protein
VCVCVCVCVCVRARVCVGGRAGVRTHARVCACGVCASHEDINGAQVVPPGASLDCMKGCD